MSEPGFKGKYFQITHTTCIFLNIFVQDCRMRSAKALESSGGKKERAREMETREGRGNLSLSCLSLERRFFLTPTTSERLRAG